MRRGAMEIAGSAGAHRLGLRPLNPARHRAFWPARALHALFLAAARRQSSLLSAGEVLIVFAASYGGAGGQMKVMCARRRTHNDP